MSFRHDQRLGIELPDLTTPYDELSHTQQEELIAYWEGVKAHIPDQIMKFERDIEGLLQVVHHEEDWDIIAAHFADISDLASRINELNMWRRVDPSLTASTADIPAHLEHANEHRDREK
ncbi:hypothetical protein D2Q93_02295 [Alicyclobacillaceae bacterium I2511]|nr:hypothetical protein D2Q93_02295 [Alicyclobacillaceae bacterium I2511]